MVIVKERVTDIQLICTSESRLTNGYSKESRVSAITLQFALEEIRRLTVLVDEEDVPQMVQISFPLMMNVTCENLKIGPLLRQGPSRKGYFVGPKVPNLRMGGMAAGHYCSNPAAAGHTNKMSHLPKGGGMSGTGGHSQ